MKIARAFILPFLGEPRDRHLHEHAHESPPLMTIPLWILAFFSIISSFFNLPFVLTLEHWLEPSLGKHEVSLDFLTFELGALTFSFVVSIFGVLMAFMHYRSKENWPSELIENVAFLQPYAEGKWYVDEFYNKVIVNPIRVASNWFADVVDQKGIDTAVNNLGRGSLYMGERASRLQNGSIPSYVLSILVGVVVVLAYFVFA